MSQISKWTCQRCFSEYCLSLPLPLLTQTISNLSCDTGWHHSFLSHTTIILPPFHPTAAARSFLDVAIVSPHWIYFYQSWLQVAGPVLTRRWQQWSFICGSSPFDPSRYDLCWFCSMYSVLHTFRYFKMNDTWISPRILILLIYTRFSFSCQHNNSFFPIFHGYMRSFL